MSRWTVKHKKQGIRWMKIGRILIHAEQDEVTDRCVILEEGKVYTCGMIQNARESQGCGDTQI